jgi:AraC-like DNA-binding protein
MKVISTEQRSDRYLHVNSCGCQLLYGVDAGSCRPAGRVDYHILYIAKGCCYLNVQGKPIEAPEGSVVVYLPFERQEYRFHKEVDSKSYYIHFSGNACEELMRAFALTDQNVFFIGKSTTLTHLLDTLIDEFHLKLDFHEETCQGLLLHILSVIARKVSDSSEKNIRIGKRIREVCRYIYANCAGNLTVSELASLCYLSESRFSHLFKERVGISPAQYVLEAKVEMAKELLKNTDFSIAHISEHVGISNQNYFSRIFKKHVGISPSDFRKM